MSISLKNAIGDFFETEEKWMTLLLLSVCQFIPIVGPIVAMGYMLRRFVTVRSGLGAPDFKFDYFGEYLQIGLWPFLASLVLGIAAIPFIFLVYSPMLLLLIDPESTTILTIAGLLVVVLYILFIGLILIVSFPVILRSGLMMNFKAGFSKRFIVGFGKKVGISLILWILLLGIVSTIAMPFGMLALGVGIYAVASIASFAQFHLLFQHYDLYLERGGEEIEIHPEVLKSATSVPPLPQTGGQV